MCRTSNNFGHNHSHGHKHDHEHDDKASDPDKTGMNAYEVLTVTHRAVCDVCLAPDTLTGCPKCVMFHVCKKHAGMFWNVLEHHGIDCMNETYHTKSACFLNQMAVMAAKYYAQKNDDHGDARHLQQSMTSIVEYPAGVHLDLAKARILPVPDWTSYFTLHGMIKKQMVSSDETIVDWSSRWSSLDMAIRENNAKAPKMAVEYASLLRTNVNIPELLYKVPALSAMTELLYIPLSIVSALSACSPSGWTSLDDYASLCVYIYSSDKYVVYFITITM